MPSLTSTSKILFALICATSVVHAHTWVEQLMVIAPNGTFVGEPGYPRGNVKRSEPGFGDPAMVHLLSDSPTAPMCKDSQKSPASQSASSPPLNAAAGANIALRFQENGHVTLPDAQLGKAKNRGDVFVYGTTEPKDNELFNDVHGVWTADGKGGDGRGVLLVKASYDDGQCYQVNGGAISTDRQKQFAHEFNTLMGADLWCQTDLRLPSDIPDGQLYTLYWVWDWATAAGIDPGLPKGKNETYTTCMDTQISAAPEFLQKVASTGFVEGQPIENAAVPDQFAKLGEQAAAPAPGESNSAAVPAAPAPSASAPAPSASAPASAPPAPTAAAPPGAAPSASKANSSAAAAPGVSTSAAVVPSVASPFPAPTISLDSVLTTISPIPAPSATASAGSALDVAPGAILTTISPIPGPSITASADSPVNSKVVSTTVSETVTVTTTVMAPASATPAIPTRAAPRIRGRNQIFHWGN